MKCTKIEKTKISIMLTG